MIRLCEVIEEKCRYEITYSLSSNTFNVVSEHMDDNSEPYKISDGVMIWVDKKGIIGEIEGIFVPEVNNEERIIQSENECTGNPTVEISQSFEEVLVENCKEGYIFWLSNKRKYNRIIRSENLKFLEWESEIVGIVFDEVEHVG